MIDPKHYDVGRRVVWLGGGARLPGKITSLNDDWVFVLFDYELHAKACRRVQLEWE